MLSAILLMLQVAPETAGAAPPAPKCEGASFEALDFWVGDWDVHSAGQPVKVADSRIEKLYAGCAIRENWMPLKGAHGGSLSGYDPASGKWHQTWFGSAPGPVVFEGGPAGGEMALTGLWRNMLGPGAHALVRMTYTRLGPNEVRQLGVQSTDDGATWQPSFDFIYRRKPAS